jgi:hypothetical protein
MLLAAEHGRTLVRPYTWNVPHICVGAGMAALTAIVASPVSA